LDTSDARIEQALGQLVDSGECPGADAIKRIVAPETIEVPAPEMPVVDLTSYDRLLGGAVEAAHEA
jgi:hypothetical protein